ncbi:Fe-S cluster assembly sulfur transfer protein SufU [Kineococcus indalonis]|uniref:Fe-S cluster assembly sulfur transfer protein SufU n=1 Tax=Kineococcus indalonis TaxID=2696566 RepID=UPI001412E300|nr:SUF system NifU family Fe-S cluster assembly protein [Kineococcus indalonis]NAZ88215.1 SUF system NifU family Fe-S cluster assembly protein [Kineococcus indalonis]
MDLHQQLVLEHARSPHGAGLRAPFTAQVHHVNPVCGDEVTLRVDLAPGPGGAVVRDVSYEVEGCSISRASASVLHDLAVGRPVAHVEGTRRAVHRMLTSRGEDPGDEEVLGDGVALAGAARYPARVKCALLPWSALADALLRAPEPAG